MIKDNSQLREIEFYLQSHLDGYLDILHRMVEINSFTANQSGVKKFGELVAQIFEPLGFESDFVASIKPNFGNHLFLKLNREYDSIKITRPTVALISHLDTVFSPEEEETHHFHWRVENNRIFGPGTIDIKGGTLMMLIVLEVLQKFRPELFNEVNWLLCFNASEEVLSHDFSQLCLERLPKDTKACLIFEAGNIENDQFKLVTARKGRAYFKVKAFGRSAHSGNNHHTGANAIVQLALLIPKIASFTDYEKRITFNVGTIKGGSVVNRVPHYAEAEVEMRAFDPLVFEQGVQQMLSLDGASTVQSQDGFRCQIKVEMLEKTQPWPHNPAT
ncbi:MAG: M20/M25/M40 family metallo-hydrolase, partial [Anaerolineales bacterium]